MESLPGKFQPVLEHKLYPRGYSVDGRWELIDWISEEEKQKLSTAVFQNLDSAVSTLQAMTPFEMIWHESVSTDLDRRRPGGHLTPKLVVEERRLYYSADPIKDEQLVAAQRKIKDEGIPDSDPLFWISTSYESEKFLSEHEFVITENFHLLLTNQGNWFVIGTEKTKDWERVVGFIQTAVSSGTEAKQEARALEQEFLAYGATKLALLNPSQHSIKRQRSPAAWLRRLRKTLLR